MENFYINQYCIKIKKCCASCISNIGSKGEFARICENGNGIVKPSDCCEKWKVKHRISKEPKLGEIDLEASGNGSGRVKRKLYLDYILNYEHPNPKFKVPIKEIRREFEEKFGSIYIKNF